jgi:MFS family permease
MSFHEAARAPRYPWANSSNNGAIKSNHQVFPSLSSSTIAHGSDIKAFDIEVDMAQNLITHDPNARPSHFRNAFEECIFVFTVMMATASTTFLQGVIIINTATIALSLNMTDAQMTWIAASIGYIIASQSRCYTALLTFTRLASGSFMLFFGKTADLLGRKIQLLAGMVFLSLTSLIAAFAPTGLALNVLCGFLGLGTAAIAPPAIGTLFATYPEGTRLNKATGALGSGNPVGFILGSISSGVATRVFNWRASFIVIAIFFFVMAFLAVWTMPTIPRPGDLNTVARKFDYLGTVLTVVGMGLFSAALTFVFYFPPLLFC